MKSNEKTNTVTVISNNPSVLDVVNAARKNNPDGSIQIDELEKKLGISRFEVIQQCREIDKGDVILVVGRKGQKSKLLYGHAALSFRANRQTKPNNHKNPGPKTEANAFRFLRLHLADNQTLDIPVCSTELVAA